MIQLFATQCAVGCAKLLIVEKAGELKITCAQRGHNSSDSASLNK